MAAEQQMASYADSGTSNVKFHAVKREHGCWVTLCGADSTGVTMMSQRAEPAASVPPAARCRKPACRKAFAAADGVDLPDGAKR